MDEYLNALRGISYADWIRVKTAIDRVFEKQKSELEQGLKFADVNIAKRIIQSQFGRT